MFVKKLLYTYYRTILVVENKQKRDSMFYYLFLCAFTYIINASTKNANPSHPRSILFVSTCTAFSISNTNDIRNSIRSGFIFFFLLTW